MHPADFICIFLHMQIKIRLAEQADAHEIGNLHAASWRTAYRGLLTDHYLDNDLQGERTRYWTQKLSQLTSKEFVFVAEQNKGIVGFIAVMDKPEAGYEALIDNLHVRPDQKGNGIGGKLMAAAATALLASGRKTVYLWVLEGNTPAEKFYISKGGRPLDKCRIEFGGALVNETRFVWDKLDTLLQGSKVT